MFINMFNNMFINVFTDAFTSLPGPSLSDLAKLCQRLAPAGQKAAFDAMMLLSAEKKAPSLIKAGLGLGWGRRSQLLRVSPAAGGRNGAESTSALKTEAQRHSGFWLSSKFKRKKNPAVFSLQLGDVLLLSCNNG